jgi:hypothetical protein
MKEQDAAGVNRTPRASDRHVPIAWKKVVALGKKWSFLGKKWILRSFSMPKPRSSLLNNNAVLASVVTILHGTHEIGLQTVQAMFGSIEGFWLAWTPIYFGPGTLYQAFEDHVGRMTVCIMFASHLKRTVQRSRERTIKFF